MSTSYRTYVVAGLKAEEAIRVEPQKKTVTKYDEDTGKPYQKEVEGPPKILLFGVHMTDINSADAETVLYAFGKKKPKALEVFHPGGYGEARREIIGVKIAQLDPCADPVQLDDDTLARGRGEARVALDQIGYNHGVHPPISIYVIHYAG